MLINFYKFIENLKTSPGRKNKIIFISIILAFAINLAIWMIIYFKFREHVYNLTEDQKFIPLHYNIYTGIDSFGSWQNIFIMPGIGLLFALINSILSLAIYSKKEILSYFLCVSAAALQIILLISTLLTILINI